VTNDPSEIILIGWFDAHFLLLIIKTAVLCNIFVESDQHFHIDLKS